MATPQILPSYSMIQNTTPPFTASMLQECVRDSSPGRGGVSWGDASETMQYDVPWTFEYGATLLILGLNFATPPAGSNPVLSRVPPILHPTKPWLYATSIDSIERQAPRGKVQVNLGNQSQTSTLSTSPTPVGGRPNANAANVPQPPQTEKYVISRFTVTFRPYMSKLYSDSQYTQVYNSEDGLNITDESQRYVEISSESSSEFLTRDGDNYRFATDPFGTAGPYLNLQQPFVTLEAKNVFKYKWIRVPEDFVCSSPGFLPTWQGALQQVNKYQFMGNPPGTLLFESYEFERHPVPGCLPQGGQTLFYLDITANMLFFSPQNRGAYEVANNIYGHNLAPMPNDAFKYHLYSTDGSLAGQRRYNSCNFSALFRAWNCTTGGLSS